MPYWHRAKHRRSLKVNIFRELLLVVKNLAAVNKIKIDEKIVKCIARKMKSNSYASDTQ